MMSLKKSSVMILMADDDEDDRMMVRDAMEEVRLVNKLDFVVDGEQLIDYLKRRGEYAKYKDDSLPGLILLDLNMPRKDGREALREIKEDPELKKIPVVVLTTSKAEEDLLKTYELGVNSFIQKPVTFEGLVQVMKAIKMYWFEFVVLPSKGDQR